MGIRFWSGLYLGVALSLLIQAALLLLDFPQQNDPIVYIAGSIFMIFCCLYVVPFLSPLEKS